MNIAQAEQELEQICTAAQDAYAKGDLDSCRTHISHGIEFYTTHIYAQGEVSAGYTVLRTLEAQVTQAEKPAA